ncbi:hypothetical protein C2S53_011353 [Perilla frutescens var. hirtella]|uniref:Uncharacterized protein n=1 Tax=Perilla frutescens var. hirtella TaxID=608512 RepID=A0AAD4J9W8_PERFH|nr:hypothetical protein C2S53_011353 [Perilla frutescens var. hirtella]
MNTELPKNFYTGKRGAMRISGGGADGVLMEELQYLLSLHHRRHQPLPIVSRQRRHHLSSVVGFCYGWL